VINFAYFAGNLLEKSDQRIPYRTSAYGNNKYLAKRQGADILVFVIMGEHGFAVYPRSGGITDVPFRLGPEPYPSLRYGVDHGGWNSSKDFEESTNKQYYPMSGNANGTALYSIGEDGEVTGEFTELEYGNLVWISADKETVYSWRGTPTRHFRVPSGTNIPTLSSVDNTKTVMFDEVPEYTCFGPNLYSGGEVLASLPKYPWADFNQGWILGAAVNKFGTYVIAYENRKNAPLYEYPVTVNDVFTRFVYANYAGAAQEQLNDGETLGTETPLYRGYPTVIYKLGGPIGGWTRVFEVATPRTGLPWFFNDDGEEATSSAGAKITIGTGGISYQDAPVFSGSRTQIIAQGEWSPPTLDSVFTWNYSGNHFFEGIGSATVSLIGASTTASNHTYVVTKATAAVKRVGLSIARELGINMNTEYIYIASFAESAQVIPLVCSWQWSTPLVETAPIGDQADPCNKNTSIQLIRWTGCGEYEWTATSNTGLTAKASGKHISYETISSVYATNDDESNCVCNSAISVYSEPTSSGRQIYTVVVYTAPSNFATKLFSWGRDTAFRNTCPCTITGGSVNEWGFNAYYGGNPVGLRYFLSGKVHLVAGTLVLGGAYTENRCADGSIYGTSTSSPCPTNTAEDVYICSDSPGYRQCQNYSGSTYVTSRTDRAGLRLRKESTCTYLGDLDPGIYYNSDGSEYILPSLLANQKYLICRIDTQVCAP
jgi:hypothetical protein